MLGDSMVLQRDQAAVVWGFADAGVVVTTTFDGADYAATADADGEAPSPCAPREFVSPRNAAIQNFDRGPSWLRRLCFGRGVARGAGGGP